MSETAHDFATLTPRQVAAVEALVAGKSLAQTATAAGVNVSTLWRWRTEDEAFRAAVRARRDAAFAEALEALRAATVEAVRTSVRLLKPSNKGEVQIAAAKAILSVALRANEAVNVEERLSALEKRPR